MATIGELLAWTGAPEALVGWSTAREGADLELLELGDAALAAMLRSLPSAGWAPWVAAVATVPMDLVLAAVGLTIESHARDLPMLGAALEEAYGAVSDEGSGEECLVAAARCDALAADPPRGFRSDTAVVAKLARATASVLRAAEAISASRARDEADRMHRARAQTARLGGGLSAWVSLSSAETVLARRLAAEPDEGPAPELAFAAAALGQALELVAEIAGEADTCAAFVDAL